MSESHEARVRLAGFHLLDEVGHLADRSDLVQHPQHRFVGAAVQRPVERRGSSGQRRIRVHVRAADVAHRARAAVLLVIGVQDEQHVERPREHRIRLVFFRRHLEQHVQEVAGEAQIVVGVDVRPADDVPKGVGGDARHLGDQAVGLPAAAIPCRRSSSRRDKTSTARRPCSGRSPSGARRSGSPP